MRLIVVFAAMLLCTVRTCHEPLTREGRRFVCPRGHSFDVARSGYVNLLQPNERRSSHPGDSLEAVQARRRLHDAGVLAPILEAIRQMAGGGDVLDVGCGDGYWLNGGEDAAGPAGETPASRVGIDISVPAIDLAARRYPGCTWLVANADRFLPVSDASFDLVLSITARMNPSEFRRVLRDDGRLLVAVPGPDDLTELRGAMERDRAERAVQEFAPHFALAERRRVSIRVPLDRQAIRDVMTSSYRAMRTRERERLDALDACDVTFSRDLLLFAAGSRGTPRDSSA